LVWLAPARTLAGV